MNIEAFETKQLLLGKIVIHWDYTLGNEISIIEGEQLKRQFTTHCLDFFQPEWPSIVISKDGCYIDMKELLSNEYKYTDKYMKVEHNTLRMLKADAFFWRKIE